MKCWSRVAVEPVSDIGFRLTMQHRTPAWGFAVMLPTKDLADRLLLKLVSANPSSRETAERRIEAEMRAEAAGLAR